MPLLYGLPLLWLLLTEDYYSLDCCCFDRSSYYLRGIFVELCERVRKYGKLFCSAMLYDDVSNKNICLEVWRRVRSIRLFLYESQSSMQFEIMSQKI